MVNPIQCTIGGALLILLLLIALMRGLATRRRLKREHHEGRLDTPPAHFSGHQWCPLCRSRLELREVCDRVRLACSNRHCQYVHWDNPKPVVLALIERDGKLVLVRRKVNPAIGSWCLPGGFLEEGESAEEACVREVAEETHLVVKVDRLLGTYSPCHSVNEIILVYSAVIVGGELAPGDDADKAEVFGKDELPDNIAFDQHRLIIADWFATHSVNTTKLACEPSGKQ
jgi:ADP-ribose pyrophosphatase YjhB (NUDIX family)